MPALNHISAIDVVGQFTSTDMTDAPAAGYHLVNSTWGIISRQVLPNKNILIFDDAATDERYLTSIIHLESNRTQ